MCVVCVSYGTYQAPVGAERRWGSELIGDGGRSRAEMMKMKIEQVEDRERERENDKLKLKMTGAKL